MKPRLPTFPLFLTRVFLIDFFSIGMLRVTEGLDLPNPVHLFAEDWASPNRQRADCSDPRRSQSGPAQRRDQEVSRRQRLGRQSLDALLVLAALRLLLRAGLLLRLVQESSVLLRRDDSRESDLTVDGMSYRPAGQS